MVNCTGRISPKYDVRIIMRPLGGKEYVVSDHLGSTRAVISDMGAILERKDYKPFGEVLATAGTGARTGYINREEDGESGLGSYEVRLYEPEYGRFTSVDLLWAEYRSVGAFCYALNNPMTQLDAGGLWVEAVSEVSQAAVRESVSERHRDAISFTDGRLDAGELFDYMSAQVANDGITMDDNIYKLMLMAQDEQEIGVTVGTTHTSVEYGEREFLADDQPIEGGRIKIGLEKVAFPSNQQNETEENRLNSLHSGDETIQVYVRANANEMTSGITSIGQATAHGLYGHVFRFLMFKEGRAVDYLHPADRRQTPSNQTDVECAEAQSQAR